MPVLLLALALLAAGTTPVRAEQPVVRQAVTLNSDYHGAHEAGFASDFDRVRLLIKQAQLEISSRLGLLQYEEGFQYPLLVRFQDGAPAGLENTLAYVQLMQMKTSVESGAVITSTMSFQQELVINLNELSAHPMDFDTVFYHEMTHAVMNDAVGGEASLAIPHWLQEGLAVYISGEGDHRVRAAAERLHRSQVGKLVYPLDNRVYGAAYPEYYLAVKYMLDTFSINAVQALVRNLIAGQTLDYAIHESMGLTLAQFKQNVREYSLNTFQSIAIPDGFVKPSRMTTYPKGL